MKKITIILSIVTLLSIGWAVYSHNIARQAIHERDKALVELTTSNIGGKTEKSWLESWQEDKKKRDTTQEKQNVIFELEDLQKEMKDTNISTKPIEHAIEILTKEE